MTGDFQIGMNVPLLTQESKGQSAAKVHVQTKENF